jgi:hypothetical protein
MTMTMVRRIRTQDTCEIQGILFVYRPGIIDVYTDAKHVDEMKFEIDEVTTTQHFEEKCMWWANDYNQI